MKKMILLAVPAALLACNGPSGNLTISGEFPESETAIISRFTSKDVIHLDTLELENGKFEFGTDIQGPEFFMVDLGERTKISLLVEPDEDVVITPATDSLGYEITGSPGSERILAINRLVMDAMLKVDSLNQVNATWKDSANYADVRNELNARFYDLVGTTREKLGALVSENPSSLSNLFAFPQTLGNIQILDPRESWEIYELADSAMNAAYPENEHAIYFRGRVQEFRTNIEMQKQMEAAMEQTAVGSPAPDIALADPNGKIRKLSDLRGQVVLIDFWASWCRPCRAENPNLVRTWEKYKSKGFTVFSVSLDGLPNQPDGREKWLEAITADGLAWENHVSDLKGWDSEVVGLYGFQGIPHTVLVDRDGTILAKDLRGVGLENKLKEIF